MNLIYLWQDGSRRIDAMLDEVESWRSRMTPASFQELVEDLKRRCIRAPKDVAVAQSPAEQTIDMEQVISDGIHDYLRPWN